jgi:hypothetical protein
VSKIFKRDPSEKKITTVGYIGLLKNREFYADLKT